MLNHIINPNELIMLNIEHDGDVNLMPGQQLLMDRNFLPNVGSLEIYKELLSGYEYKLIYGDERTISFVIYEITGIKRSGKALLQ